MSQYQTLTRRKVLAYLGASATIGMSGVSCVAAPLLPLARQARAQQASSLAQDEKYWAEIALHYDLTEGITNLEHGYWGKMAKSVQQTYLSEIQVINQQNSFYARKDYSHDHMESVHRIARALGVEDDEIVLTRNATEAIHNLIRQYRNLNEGDAILYADLDYPGFKSTMAWLAIENGLEGVEVEIPSRANQVMILQTYVDAFDQHPNLKLMLLTHVSNQHGLVLPVKAIAKEAKKRGIDVICDNAQSWGLLNYKLPELEVDWVGFNLHKWIGAPVGVGALYMKRGSLEKIAPYPGETDPDHNKAYKRIHMATSNFAAFTTVPTALDFHEEIGGANKEARLRYLRSLWTQEAELMPGIEVLGGLDEASRTGMASFRLNDKTTKEDAINLQQKLEKEFHIFTVIRLGLASGACVRITPQVFSTPDDMAKLVAALRKISLYSTRP